MESLKKRGIQSSIHYPPIHHFQAYHSYDQQRTSLRITEEIAAQELTLPLYPGMANEDIELVVRSIQSSLGEQ